MKRILAFIFYIIAIVPLVGSAQWNNTSDTSSQLNIALKNASLIGINQTQIVNIQKKYQLLNDSILYQQQHVDSIVFNRYAFESFYLNKILTPAQYSKVLEIKNSAAALATAQQKWAEAVQKNVTLNYIKDTAIGKMTAYYLEYKSIVDRFAHDVSLKESRKKNLENATPIDLLALMHANPFWAADMRSDIGFALLNQQDLSLSVQQYNTLLSKARNLQKSTVNVTSDSAKNRIRSAFDKANLPSILSTNQLEKILSIKYLVKSKQSATNKWNEAISKNATGDYIKDSALNQLTLYFYKKNCLFDKYRYDTIGKQSAIDNFEKSVSIKLKALIRADLYWGLDKQSAIVYVLQNQQALTISQAQATQLLAKAQQERQKDDAAKLDSTKVYNKKAFQYAQLKAILSAPQYNQYFALKYKSKADAEALAIWNNAVSKQATGTYVKDTALAQLGAYQLQKLVISDKFSTDTLNKNKALAQLEASISPALKSLYYGDVYWGLDKQSAIVYVLQNQQALTISQAQATQLLAKAQLERQKDDAAKLDSTKVYNKKAFQYAQLKAILSAPQYNQYFALKYKAKADAEALAIWNNAVSKQATGTYVKDTALAQLGAYQLQKLVISDKFSTDTLNKNKALAQLEASISPALKSLYYGDVYWGLDKQSAIVYVLQNQQALTISQAQATQLLAKAQQERQKDDAAKLDSTKVYNKKAFQYAQLKAILSAPQYNQYFALKYKSKADAEALAIWNNAVTKQATGAYVKDTALAQLGAYQLQKLVISDKFSTDTLSKNKALAQLEASINHALKSLYYGDVYWGLDKQSAIVYVLQNQQALTISQAQATQLLAKAQLERQKDDAAKLDSTKVYNKKAFQYAQLKAILSAPQYNQYFALKYKSKADAEALAIWNSAVAKQATGAYVKDTALAQLGAYQLQKLVIGDKFSTDTLSKNKALAQLEASINPALKSLYYGDVYWGLDKQSAIVYVLQNQQALTISQAQATQLLAKAQLERQKDDAAKLDSTKVYNKKAFQYAQLKAILSAPQYNQYFALKYKSKADAEALAIWNNAVAKQATGTYVKDTALAQLGAYQLQKLVISDKFSTDTLNKNKALAQLEASINPALKSLYYGDVYWGLDKQSALVYVLQNQQALTISQAQATQLLAKAQLERQKDDAAKLDSTKVYNKKAFQYAQLKAILSAPQYNQYFALKYKSKADAEALAIWNNAVAKQATGTYVKDTALAQLGAYQLQKLVISDKFSTDTLNKNKALAQLEASINPALKSLYYGDVYWGLDKQSAIVYVLQNQQTLTISQAQATQLLAKAQLERQKDDAAKLDSTKVYNKKAFQYAQLKAILSAPQYNQYFALKYKSKADAEALAIWNNAVTKQATGTYVKDTALAQLGAYQLQKLVISDKFSTDTLSKNKALAQLEASISPALKSLYYGDVYWGLDKQSAIVYVLQNQQALTISQAQATQLLAKAQLERQKDDAAKLDSTKVYNKKAFQYAQLKAILSAPQYNQYFALKYKSKADAEALAIWNNAVTKQATGTYVKDTALAQLGAYQLQKLVISDKFSTDTLSKNKALAQLEASISPALKSLYYGDVYWGLDKQSAIVYVLQNQQALTISQAQATQLLAKAQLERQKDDAAKLDSTKVYNKKAFQYAQLKAILSAPQYNQYFALKYKSKADAEANRVWNAAVTKNATEGWIKDTALQKLSYYYLQKQRINEESSLDTATQKAALTLLENTLSTELIALMKGNLFWGAEMNTNIGFALKNQSSLNLSQAQAKVLLINARLLSQRLKGITHDSTKVFIKDSFDVATLNSTFDTIQIGNLYTLKNKPKGFNDAVKKWDIGVQKGYTNGLIKDSIIGQLTDYFATKRGITERYTNNKLRQYSAFSRLDATVPKNLWLFISGGNSLTRPSVGLYTW